VPTPDLWDPDHPAIWEEPVPGESRAITLRHPSYPFAPTGAITNPDALISIAAAYLRKVSVKFGLPANLVSAAGPSFDAIPPSGIPLTWLPFVPAGTIPGPLNSFWVNRYRDLSGSKRVLADRTAVVLAVQSKDANKPATALGSRLGIRIVAQVSPTGTMRITSSTCSNDLAKRSGPPVGALSVFLENFFKSASARRQLRGAILEVAGANPGDQLWFDGLRVRGTGRQPTIVEGYAYIQRPAGRPYAFPYALTWQATFSGRSQTISILEKAALVAHAAPVSARLFPQSPADQAGPGQLVEARPNRAPKRLEPYRQPMPLPGLVLVAGNTKLLDNLGQVQVMRSKLLDKSADETKEEIVAQPATVPHARMSPFAALSGYQHARELFDTMRAYGFDPTEYFRHASWPLRVRYRAPINPGPGKDGKTVNAQVDYDPPGSDLNAWDPTTLEPLQVRFALADLKRSTSRREPLGLTADPRWSWHEYGHVLLAASTGELELRFAHSAGDALAAIKWDPVSRLAPSPPLRLATFPWVYLNRRHDRSVYAGWSWRGTYHRSFLFYQDANWRRRKGYKSEQILSTSLFRVYRVLGGDTVLAAGTPDVGVRQAASDVTVYLIMRAIDILATMVPTLTPDQFVTALSDADVGTWSLPSGWVGGCAHKVVRWAFEAQGLYAATTDPLAVIDAPGQPPDIDVYIDNGRPDSEGAHPRGGYMPVSLDWNTSPAPWHATSAALQAGNGQVSVRVANRGQSAATGVVVRVSHASWPAAQPVPPWNTTAWQVLGTAGPQTVPGGSAVVFGPLGGLPTGSGRYLILAEATCAGDLANTDPATDLPCSTQPTPLVPLVAGDNNLGLRLLTIP
jgi:hypothetical protein